MYSAVFLLSLPSDPSADDSGVVPLDQDDKDDQEKFDKLKKKANKSTKPKYEAKGRSTFSHSPMSCDTDDML